MKIGIFDSGIGGLSVLQEAYHQLPKQEFIFYADTELRLRRQHPTNEARIVYASAPNGMRRFVSIYHCHHYNITAVDFFTAVE